MLYDLNIPWTTSTSPAELQRTLSFLSELGYQTLALNNPISTPIPSQILNPLPKTLVLPPKVTLLTRCTLTLADPTQNHRLPQLSSAYDILALRPTTEKAFLAACQTLTEHSLISLDLTTRFPFHFKPKPLMTAVNRGVRIEICYSQGVGGDPAGRRNFIGNLMAIVRATRGRGLIVSSEAKGVLQVRPPADVVNLLAVWGLGREKGEEALGVNPRGVVINEGLKRSSFRGVVDVVFGGEREVPVVQVETKKGVNGVGKNGKRKADDADETPTKGPPSKRQAKKLKKMEEEKAKSASGTPAETLIESTPMEAASTESDRPDSPSSIKAKADG